MAKRPPKPPGAPEAVAYFRNKEQQPSFSWQDVAPEEHAFSFTVAKATKIEVLNTIRAEVDAAIANGETVESFKARLGPKLIALGWWGKQKMVDPETGEEKLVQLGSPRRLDTIYWANTRTAQAAGTWERAQRTKEALPYFIYELGPSEVHRPAHEALEGTVLPVDDDFWQAHFPPNGWGCKCWVRQITKSEADKSGYDPEKVAPDLGTRTYTNVRTGETRSIPVGIDPGWESNPGRLRQRNLGRHIAGQLDDAPPELQRVATRDVISSQEFQRIQARQAKGVAPVGVAPRSMQEQLGGQSRTILFSDDTARKQAGERKPGDPGHLSTGHPEVTANDYLNLQGILDHGRSFPDRENHISILGEVNGQWWNAIVKVTRDGKENYLQSFYPLDKKKLEQKKRRYGWK